MATFKKVHSISDPTETASLTQRLNLSLSLSVSAKSKPRNSSKVIPCSFKL